MEEGIEVGNSRLNVFLILCTIAVFLASDALGEAERIAFVNVRIVRGELALEGVAVVEGRLKRPKRLRLAKGKLYYEVLDVSGQRLFEATMPDPTLLRLEYADDTGSLHSRTVARDSVYFSVRIPYEESAHLIRFYRVDVSPHAGGALRKDAQLVGSVPIDLLGVNREE
jgi:hypothetical protein